ncbi:MAG: hypothetical protein PWP24_1296 [Clostridiales bacterium]|nr:hypothetical protein [Clostridiales bacterium]
MGYLVYYDVYFLWNVCMDFLLLSLYGSFTNKKKSIIRRVFASILGGGVSLVGRIGIPIPLACFIFVMVFVAYPGLSFKESIKAGISLVFIAWMLGGGICFLEEQGLKIRHIWECMFASGLVLYILRIVLMEYGKRLHAANVLYPITLMEGSIKISGIGLMDTGNQLYDPYFHRPVMIGDYEKMKELEGVWSQESFLMIPYQSLGKKSGMIPAIKMKELVIERKEGTMHISPVIVGIAKESLSKNNQFQFILHRDYLKG